MLVEWLKENGARLDKLKVRFVNTMQQSLFASKDIKKGEIVLLIPHELVVASKALSLSEVG